MDINIAHDIIHENAGSSESCKVCLGEVTGKAATVKEATRISEERQKRHNSMKYPMMLNETTNELFTISEVVMGDDGEAPKEIMLMPIGKFNTTKYGVVEIKATHIQEMIKNFKGKTRAGVPIDTGHDADAPANGWITKLIDKGKDGLWAAVDWTAEGKEKLEKKLFKFMSPEFSLNHRDPLTSKLFGATLIAGTLTNRPLFRQMTPIVASEMEEAIKEGLTNENQRLILFSDSKAESNMTINDLISKDLKDLLAEEKDFLTANKDRLTFDEKKKFELLTADEIKAGEMKKCATCAKEYNEADMAKHVESHKTKKATDKDEVVMTASEVETLKAQALKATEYEATIKATETEKKVSSFMFSEKGGKVAPAGKDALTKLVSSFDEVQSNLFDEVMKAVPEKNMFSEIGGDNADENTSLTIAQQVDKLAGDKMKADDTLTYSKAINMVFSENEKLKEEYDKETKSE